MTAPERNRNQLCEMCSHLAVALTAHRDFAQREYGSVPPALQLLTDAYRLSVTSRQGPTNLDHLAPSREPELVPLLVDLDTASALLSLDRRTVERRIAAGDISAVKVGRRTLIRRTDLDTYIAGLPAATSSERRTA